MFTNDHIFQQAIFGKQSSSFDHLQIVSLFHNSRGQETDGQALQKFPKVFIFYTLNMQIIKIDVWNQLKCFFRASNSPTCEESWYAKTRQGNTKDRFTLASHKISQMLTPLLMRNVDMHRTRHSIYLVPLSVFRRTHCTWLLMRYYMH